MLRQKSDKASSIDTKKEIAKRAKANQAAGGGAVPQKSAKPIETRKEIAKVANVSHDTVAKANQVASSWLKSQRGKPVAGRYSFTTWEEYVGERWDMTFQRAHDVIQNALAAEKLRNFGTFDSLPSRESHVRELLKLETDEQRAEVWQQLNVERQRWWLASWRR